MADAETPTRLGSSGSRSHTVVSPLPPWLRRVVAYGLAALVLSLVAWLVVTVLLRVGLLAFSLLVALLLAALVAPLSQWLGRAGLPRWLGALLSVLVLVGLPTGVGYLVYSRVMVQMQSIGPAVTEGIDQIRDWLVDGPIGLDPARIDTLRQSAVDAVGQALPSPVAGTTTALHVLTGVLLVLFAVFFLLKDGPTMWGWLLSWVGPGQRDRVDSGGTVAWSTLTAYVRGTALIALSDAAGIGLGLLVLGVPLWLSLTLVTFFGAFVPIIGATVAGAAAVLVTLVTNGLTDALIILGVVLLVQQVEGNVLQPLIMSGVVRLHPLVTVASVTAGTLVLGVAGAVLAVPVVAVAYRVVDHLSGHEDEDEDEDEVDGEDRARGDGDRTEGPDADDGHDHSTRREHQHR